MNVRRPSSVVAAIPLIVASASASDEVYRIVRFDPPYSSILEAPGIAAAVPSTDTLRPPFFVPMTATSYAYGINEQGVVVGAAYACPTAECDSTSEPVYRPFLWQPELLHASVLANHLNFLALPPDSVSGLDDTLWGAALDVNESGDVVGSSGATLLGGDLGFLWVQQSGLGLTPAQLNTFVALAASNGLDSAARGISDRGYDGTKVTAFVGGQSSGENPCCSGAFLDPAYWDLADGLVGSILPLDCASSLIFEIGGIHDVNRFGPAEGLFLAGVTDKCSADLACRATTDRVPSAWDLGATPENPLISLASTPLSWTNGYVFAVNGRFQVAGYVERNEAGDCLRRAARWDRASVTDPFVLTELASPIDADNDTRAYGMNGLGQVVGADELEEEAVLWRSASDRDLLSDLTDCVSCGLDAIVEAFDINDAGWIVGTASYTFELFGEPVESRVGVLLVPLGDCPADINQDGVVDSTDLALVDTSAGCEPLHICWADVNGDCVVDVEDRRIVLQSMTSAACSSQTLSSSLAAIWLNAGGNEYLEGDPQASESVEAAYDDQSEVTTFVNLMMLIIEEDA